MPTSINGQMGAELPRRTVTLAELLRSHSAPRVIEYLSLDVEGHEMEVLEEFPFEEFTFLAITLEIGLLTPMLQGLLRRNNYTYARHLDKPGAVLIQQDEMWVHASMRAKVPLLLTSELNCAAFACHRGPFSWYSAANRA